MILSLRKLKTFFFYCYATTTLLVCSTVCPQTEAFFQSLLLVWALPWHFICVCLCHTRIPSLNFVSICTNSAQRGFSNSCCIDDILVLFMSLRHTKFLCKRKSISFRHFTFTSTTTGRTTAQVVTGLSPRRLGSLLA